MVYAQLADGSLHMLAIGRSRQPSDPHPSQFAQVALSKQLEPHEQNPSNEILETTDGIASGCLPIVSTHRLVDSATCAPRARAPGDREVPLLLPWSTCLNRRAAQSEE